MPMLFHPDDETLSYIKQPIGELDRYVSLADAAGSMLLAYLQTMNHWFGTAAALAVMSCACLGWYVLTEEIFAYRAANGGRNDER